MGDNATVIRGVDGFFNLFLTYKPYAMSFQVASEDTEEIESSACSFTVFMSTSLKVVRLSSRWILFDKAFELNEVLTISVYACFIKTRGSGCKHKAWGGAKRNPRMTELKDRVREASDSPPTANNSCRAAVAHFAGSFSVPRRSWGSASLHPRLYALAALRGLKQEPTFCSRRHPSSLYSTSCYRSNASSPHKQRRRLE